MGHLFFPSEACWAGDLDLRLLFSRESDLSLFLDFFFSLERDLLCFFLSFDLDRDLRRLSSLDLERRPCLRFFSLLRERECRDLRKLNTIRTLYVAMV